MGTSRALRGPSGTGWDRAVRAGRQWRVDPGTSVGDFGGACRRALADDLAADPDKFGLRPAMLSAGERLLDTLEALQRDGLDAILTPEDMPKDISDDAIRLAFTDAVAGRGTLITETSVRRAAGRCADLLVEREAGREDGSGRRNGSQKLTGELFCELYTLFFGEVVGEFLKTAVAAKVVLAAPILPLLPLGAGGELAAWVAKSVARLIPNPCEETQKPDNAGGSLADVGRKLLRKAVHRSLDAEDPVEAGDVVVEAV